MSRTFMDIPFAMDPAFLQHMAENNLVGEGYHPVEYNGEPNVWKKGTGMATAMHYIKLEYPEPGLLRLSGWVQAGVGSVGGKERDLSGFVAIIPKRSTLSTMKRLQSAVLSYNAGPGEVHAEQPAWQSAAPQEAPAPEAEPAAPVPEPAEEISSARTVPGATEEAPAAEPVPAPIPEEPPVVEQVPAEETVEATAPAVEPVAEIVKETVEEVAEEAPVIDPETEANYENYLAAKKKAEELAAQTLNAKPAPAEEAVEAASPAAEPVAEIVEKAVEEVAEETPVIDPETEANYARYLAAKKKAEELAAQTLSAKPAPAEEDDLLKKKLSDPVETPSEEPVPAPAVTEKPAEETSPFEYAPQEPLQKKTFDRELSSNEPTRIFSKSELMEAARKEPPKQEPAAPAVQPFHYEDIYSTSRAQRKAERQAEKRTASAETDSIPFPVPQQTFPPADDGRQTIFCSGCGVKLRVQKTPNRLRVTCPKCGEVFIYEP